MGAAGRPFSSTSKPRSSELAILRLMARKSGDHRLRLVVYPIYLRGFIAPRWWSSDFFHQLTSIWEFWCEWMWMMCYTITLHQQWLVIFGRISLLKFRYLSDSKSFFPLHATWDALLWPLVSGSRFHSLPRTTAPRSCTPSRHETSPLQSVEIVSMWTSTIF